MPNIQLIIEIPEYLYKAIQSYKNPTNEEKAIANGIPLPKGHGRILDEKDILDTENNGGDWYDLYDMPAYIVGVKAIIEADKE